MLALLSRGRRKDDGEEREHGPSSLASLSLPANSSMWPTGKLLPGKLMATISVRATPLVPAASPLL